MASVQKVNYPSNRDVTETERLQLQHDLVVHALGALILAPLDTSKPNLRILDLATANGLFLSRVRSQLHDPDSATLIGTDLALYPNTQESVIVHDFKTPFPDDWSTSFDFVQLRACLANCSREEAISLIQRVLDLLKPGAYIQIVDSCMPAGEIEPADSPRTKFVKICGNFLQGCGMHISQGKRCAELLEVAGKARIANINSKQADIRFGKVAEPQMVDQSLSRLRGQLITISKSIEGQSKSDISMEKMQALRAAVLAQAEEQGFTMTWYAAWAQKA